MKARITSNSKYGDFRRVQSLATFPGGRVGVSLKKSKNCMGKIGVRRPFRPDLIINGLLALRNLAADFSTALIRKTST
jgi:hypothetical protein